MNPELSVIICTFNRCESLKTTLKSLREMVVHPDLGWDLTVVDNNSKDHTRQVIDEFAAIAPFPVHYVFESRPGLSYARNTGIEKTTGGIIAFTDDDVTLEQSWLTNVHAAFKQSECKAIGGKVSPVWSVPQPVWFADKGPFATPRAIVSFDLGDKPCVAHAYPCGANMAFRREVFARYGNFRVDLGRIKNTLLGGEDFDFFQRMMSGGDEIFYFPEALVFHPVTAERVNKKYFEAWCYNGGKSSVRFEGLPKQAVYWFGFPRFYVKTLLESVVKYLFTFEPKRRFYYRLQVYITIGRIVETRKLVRAAT